MRAIYKRELASYFHSMTGYVYIAFFTFFLGIYFMAYNLMQGYPYFSVTLNSVVIVLLLATPVLTMRSLAEERRTKTEQLLHSSPVTVWQIVLGKYLSMITVFAAPVLIACICPLVIRINGTACLREDYASLLAFFLMGCIYIAVGLFVSSLTESTVIAAVGTYACLFALILWPSLIHFLPVSAAGSLAGFLILLAALCLLLYQSTKHLPLCAALFAVGATILAGLYCYRKNMFDYALFHLFQKMAVSDIFDNFTLNHLFDAEGLIYYLSAIFLLLFLTVQSIEKRRWS